MCRKNHGRDTYSYEFRFGIEILSIESSHSFSAVTLLVVIYLLNLTIHIKQ